MTKKSNRVKRSVKGKGLNRRLWVLVVAALIVVGPLPGRVVEAATITVAAGEVAILDNNICSLREAVINANLDTNNPGLGGHDDCAAGSGADTAVLAAGSTYTLMDAPAAFDADGKNGLPSITGQITIQGNSATIRRDPSVTCDLDFTTDTGEFRIFRIASTGNLTLNAVTVSNGCADGTGSNNNNIGGGVLNSFGTVTIMSSTLSGNSAFNPGGGIYNTSGTVTIVSSVVSGNSGNGGGGIYNNSGTVTIMSSTLSGNSTGSPGGGIYNGGGTVTIMSSTVSGNSAGSFGGGIYSEIGTVTIMSSTVSGNSAGSLGGGIRIEVGGTVAIMSSTVSGNSADSLGGGISNDGTVNIKNSIVANSPSGGNCYSATLLTASGMNFATDGSCPMFTMVTPAQLNLGPLQLNAPGTTRTHALMGGSVAINAATDCTLLDGTTPVTTDQRGITRPQGLGCDVGAYEALVQSPTFFTIQGNGICLTLNLRTHQYIFKTGQRMIAGIFSFRQSGQVIRFQSAYGDVNRLTGWINLSTKMASAVLTLPLSLGGGRFVINDANIADNAPCL
jgi:hypothetical protein